MLKEKEGFPEARSCGTGGGWDVGG